MFMDGFVTPTTMGNEGVDLCPSVPSVWMSMLYLLRFSLSSGGRKHVVAISVL